MKNNIDWMTTKEAAALWGVTMRRIQSLCENGLLDGAEKLGDIWIIPKGTTKPIDGRTKHAKQMQLKHEGKKPKLDKNVN